MLKHLPAAAIAIALAACSPTEDPPTEPGTIADTVLINGTIYTVDASGTWAEAIAIRGGDILYVGEDAGARDYVGESTVVEDLGGRFVMPGIISTHEHSIFFMAVASGLNIEELSHDKDKMLAEVAAYLEENPDGPFMSYGGGYESTVKIDRAEIDAITGPDRPFFMMSKTGHAGWANSKALELAGVTDDEEPIDFFEKDEDGRRNGYVGTAAAAYYMMGVAGLQKDAVLAQAPGILEQIASNGITHMFEAGQPPGYEAPLFDAIGQLEAEGKLTTRYTVSCMVQRAHQIPAAIDCLKKYNAKYNSEFFKVDTMKIHGDGSFEGHTAFLLEPYSDAPDKIGILSVPEEKSIEAAVEAASLGFSLHTHAIGDAANRSFLNVMEAVREAGHTDARLAMGHTKLVDEADMQRFADLDVIANFYVSEAGQPNQTYLERLGPERDSNRMRLGTFVDMGVTVALSQDFPSAPLSPFPHMHAAVTRSVIGEDEILGTEDEKLTVAQAIRAYTLDAAKMVTAESYSGSLEVGKRADLIVLDRNLFEIEPDDIVDTVVLRTIVNGQTVYSAETD